MRTVPSDFQSCVKGVGQGLGVASSPGHAVKVAESEFVKALEHVYKMMP